MNFCTPLGLVHLDLPLFPCSNEKDKKMFLSFKFLLNEKGDGWCVAEWYSDICWVSMVASDHELAEEVWIVWVAETDNWDWRGGVFLQGRQRGYAWLWGELKPSKESTVSSWRRSEKSQIPTQNPMKQIKTLRDTDR